MEDTSVSERVFKHSRAGAENEDNTTCNTRKVRKVALQTNNLFNKAPRMPKDAIPRNQNPECSLKEEGGGHLPEI